MRYVFWQNYPNHHQSATLRALADTFGHTVILAVEENLTQWRQYLGWESPDLGQVVLYVQPDNAAIDHLLAENPSQSVHIFSGLRSYPLISKAMRRSLAFPVQRGIMSEPARQIGKFWPLKLVKSYSIRLRYGHKLDFILAIGHLAIRWFRMSGFPADKIYPFGYFLETPTALPSPSHSATFQLVFVGQCVHRKGIDLLLDALNQLKHLQWELRVVGDGVQRQHLETMATGWGLKDRVFFLGARSNSETTRIIETSDLLVLPSRWDGWGAVVNEALMRGVPVVCSSNCGAADLLIDPALGEIFDSGSVTSLRRALSHQISQGNTLPERSRKILAQAQCMTGEVAAKYICDVVSATRNQGPRPVPRWRVDCSDVGTPGM